MAVANKGRAKAMQPLQREVKVTPERRREVRYPTHDAALVRELPPCHGGLPMPGTVIDISKSGLRLELGSELWKDVRIEVTISPRKLVIFGQVRYCRRAGAVFYVGVLIEGVVHPKADDGQHLHDDLITLYLVGKGLTVPELLRAKEHILVCDVCSA